MGWSLNPGVRLLREGLKKTRALWGVENTELSEEQLWGLCNLPVALPAHHGAMKHAWAPDLEVAPTTAASINYNRLVPNTNSWFVCNYKKKNNKKKKQACVCRPGNRPQFRVGSLHEVGPLRAWQRKQKVYAVPLQWPVGLNPSNS